jgi:Alpha-L-fucosidase C-terminal domain
MGRRTFMARFIYAYALAWPGRELALKTVKAQPNTRIDMLGVTPALRYRNDPTRGLAIEIPAEVQAPAKRPCDFTWAFCIEGTDAA